MQLVAIKKSTVYLISGASKDTKISTKNFQELNYFVERIYLLNLYFRALTHKAMVFISINN